MGGRIQAFQKVLHLSYCREPRLGGGREHFAARGASPCSGIRSGSRRSFLPLALEERQPRSAPRSGLCGMRVPAPGCTILSGAPARPGPQCEFRGGGLLLKETQENGWFRAPTALVFHFLPYVTGLERLSGCGLRLHLQSGVGYVHS